MPLAYFKTFDMMDKPNLQELRYASAHGGRLPDSYFKRIDRKPDKVEQAPRGVETVVPGEETDAADDFSAPEWPQKQGAFWVTSDGKKARKEEIAIERQKKIDGA